jgi:membrane-bound inhibitor of C-type lysozyme
MKVHLVIVASLLSLTACSDQQISTAYLCNKNTVILNVINNKNAELTFNNDIYLLNHEESASGNKYINENVLFWGKGNNAMLIVAGKKYQCTTN